MKTQTTKKRHVQTSPKRQNTDELMRSLQDQYRAAGVTEQELAMIQSAAGAGDRLKAAQTIALVLARLEEEGLLRVGVAQ